MAPPITQRLVTRLHEQSKEKGLWGSSGGWLAVWVLIVGGRLLVKLAAPKPVVVRERLEPGHQLVITHLTETMGQEKKHPT